MRKIIKEFCEEYATDPSIETYTGEEHILPDPPEEFDFDEDFDFPDQPMEFNPEEDFDYSNPSMEFDPDEEFEFPEGLFDPESEDEARELFNSAMDSIRKRRSRGSQCDDVWLVNIKKSILFDYFCRVMDGLVKLGCISGKNFLYGDKNTTSGDDINNKSYSFKGERVDILYPRLFAQKLLEIIEEMKGGIFSFTIITVKVTGVRMIINFTDMAKKISNLND